jgi:hypothetical protein
MASQWRLTGSLRLQNGYLLSSAFRIKLQTYFINRHNRNIFLILVKIKSVDLIKGLMDKIVGEIR